jgi:hydrogenase nickel incorporation protein HypA/HybF
MHEMALAESVLGIVETTARRDVPPRESARTPPRVTLVRLAIGTLSHVDPHALAFCFEAVVKGSIAEGAVLDIVGVPGEAWCMPCGERVALARRGDPCPRCGSYQLQVVAGDEMRVKEIALA